MDRRDARPELRPQGLERWVVNLKDRSLSKPQEDVLRLGLNFAPAPTKLPLVGTIAAVEEGARQLGEDAEDLRGRVCGILRHAKPPKDNLTKEQRKALKELRSLEDEVILPADKGNATVVMTRGDYDSKMRGMLDTTTYRRLKKDPTATQEAKLSQRLKGLEKDGELSGRLYHQLRPTGSQPPRIYYGFPKIHKAEGPSQTHCLVHWGLFLPTVQTHHFSHIPPSRQDGLACEELQALCGADDRPES